ncbi:hypothetical protein ACIQU6_30880 [Streptomyces sp. NPDC090442]|uniref:hypothetical protein n=1 Tax=Streptomyces sp. NPDC090442 TaxID=3365962 RepID=UPI003820D7E3
MAVLDLVSAAADTAHHVAHLDVMHLADVPNPGGGTRPPGAEKLTKVLGWAAWTVTAICVGGILAVAGKMALNHRRGEGGEHAMALGVVLVACCLAGTASAIVGALI